VWLREFARYPLKGLQKHSVSTPTVQAISKSNLILHGTRHPGAAHAYGT
jgi:hypothetical protein